MNYSDYLLHGISPFYDQTIFTRCHLCRNVVKLPQLADHLDKRHNNVNNDQNSVDTSISENAANTIKPFSNQNSTIVDFNSSISNNISSNKKGRKPNPADMGSSSSNELKATKTVQLTKIKNKNKSNKKLNSNEIDLTKHSKMVGDDDLTHKHDSNESLYHLINNESIKKSEQSIQSNVAEKIKNKIIGAKKTDLKYPESTNEIPSSKSLPKLIIKKDKSSTNNEVFYLNNVVTQQHSTQNNSESQFNVDKRNSFNEYKESDEMFKHYPSQSSINSSFSNIKTITSSNSVSKTKDYDPNKHCGVMVETFDSVTKQKVSHEPCTRSLSCKKHSISLRRQVTGRSKSFNELFKEFNNEKEGSTSLNANTTNVNSDQQNKTHRKINRKKISASQTLPIEFESKESNHSLYDLNNQSEIIQNQTDLNNDYNNSGFMRNMHPTELSIPSNNNFLNKKSPSKFKPFVKLESNKTNENEEKKTQTLLPPPQELNSANLNENLIRLNLNFSNSMLAKHHPRPSAVTSFNARLTENGGGYTLWNRKQDNLRLSLSNAFSQTNNFLDRNRCFTTDNEPISTSPINEATNILNASGKISNNSCHLFNNQLDQTFKNGEIVSSFTTNELNGIKFESNHVQNNNQISPKNCKKRITTNIQSDMNYLNNISYQPQVNASAMTHLDNNQKQKMKKSKLLNNEESSLAQPSAKLAKLNDKQNSVSLNSNNKNNIENRHKIKSSKNNVNLNDFDDFDHLEKNQLNSIEISNGTNFVQHSSNDKYFSNTKEKTSAMLNGNHILNENNINNNSSQQQQNDLTTFLKYPLSGSSSVPLKNPTTNNLKTLNNFLLGEDDEDDDDDIIETTSLSNFRASKVNNTKSTSPNLDDVIYHPTYLKINNGSNDKLVTNSSNNRQQKKSVSLSPSPSSSSSSSTISSLNLNTNNTNANNAYLLNTIN